jgi:hypothetical protein
MTSNIKEQSNAGVIGHYTITKRNKKGEITDRRVIKNLVVDGGLQALAQAIGNGGTVEPLSHIAVGSGTSAVTGGDTDLETEIIKKPKSLQSIAGSTVYISITLDYTEANGTINEIGVFVDTDTLFSRVSTEHANLPMTKNSTETLTIDYQLNIVNA